MKEYQTEIIMNASIDQVWDVLTDFPAYPQWNPLIGWLKGNFITKGQIEIFVKPLNRSFQATLKKVQKYEEFTWVGVQIAPWIISGEHYYRLEKKDETSTRLIHGECFRGLGSLFISKAMLETMENSFRQHNQLLKERVENE